MFVTLRGNYVNPLYVESLYVKRGTKVVDGRPTWGWYVRCRTASGDDWPLFFGTEGEAKEKLKEYAEKVRRAGVSELLRSIRDEIAGLVEVTDPAYSRPRVNPCV